jgi:predicted short-subunit dehydrogenase-like oxidoreductase (DUF2520 family)
MINIVLIGGGNVAHHLVKVFLYANNIRLLQVCNRSIKAIKYLEDKVDITNDFNNLKEADIYIVCVADKAISKVSDKIDIGKSLIVHTSGSTDINVLKKHTRKGVFYPLQTFSKGRNVNFSKIPICIESSNKLDELLLETLAKSISKQLYNINSNQRKQLHIAAIFANNFTNYLYSIANSICKEHNIEPNIMLPLIQETANKIEEFNPYDAQTGPARRGDNEIINEHLKELNENQKELYKSLSKSIANSYGKKL